MSEFLQNVTELKDDLSACIDIHRNSLWLVDVKLQTPWHQVSFGMVNPRSRGPRAGTSVVYRAISRHRVRLKVAAVCAGTKV